MASIISRRPWPALVMSTPEDQSIQRLPYASKTWKPSAWSQTTGGCPAIASGSQRRSFSRIGTDSGTGRSETILRSLVSTRGTRAGVSPKSLAINVILPCACLSQFEARQSVSKRFVPPQRAAPVHSRHHPDALESESMSERNGLGIGWQEVPEPRTGAGGKGSGNQRFRGFAPLRDARSEIGRAGALACEQEAALV